MTSTVTLFIKTEKRFSVESNNIARDIINKLSTSIEDLVNEFKDTYEIIDEEDADIITDSIMDNVFLEEYLPMYLPEDVDVDTIDWDITEYGNEQLLNDVREIINSKVEEVINKLEQ